MNDLANKKPDSRSHRVVLGAPNGSDVQSEVASLSLTVKGQLTRGAHNAIL